jgi:cysteine desulfurase family protein (TIGR01976 family)
VLDDARLATAEFLNASRPEEIVFGPNMTTLTLSLARALGRELSKGDSIVVTRLDHDANISPWMHLAQDKGCELHWADFDVEDGTLQMDSLVAALETRPKLVAVGYASNALGTINPVKQITQMAHDVGAKVFIDAVQYAPHGITDVQDLACDYLACSAYKFFGPHVGILYGKYDLLDEAGAYKVRPASDLPPGKFETGTQNHEGIAGTLGALEYIAWLADSFGAGGETRQDKLHEGMRLIQTYEIDVSNALIQTLENVPGVTVYGLTDPARTGERVPTIAFNKDGYTPRQIAEYLAGEGMYVWNGNYYALAVTERLGVESSGGMVRVGPVHYNTLEEIERLGHALMKLD